MSTRSSRRRPVAVDDCFNVPTAINTRKRNAKQKENLDETDISEASLKTSPIAIINKVSQTERAKRKRNVLKEQNRSLQSLDFEDKSAAPSNTESDVIKPRKGRSRKALKNDEEQVNDSVSSQDLNETSKKKKKTLKRQDAIVSQFESELPSEDDTQINIINSKKSMPKSKKGKKNFVATHEFESESAPQTNEIVEKPTKKSRRRRNYVSLIENEMTTSSEQSDSDNIYPNKNIESKKGGKKSNKSNKSGKNNDVDEVDNDETIESFHSAAGSPKELERKTIESVIENIDQPLNGTYDKNSPKKSLRKSMDIFESSPTVLLHRDFDKSLSYDCELNKSAKRETYSISPDKRSDLPVAAETPTLKREGTFTKETSDESSPHTPEMMKKSFSAPGSTPYHPNGLRVTRTKSDLNRTHSIEKRDSLRRSSSTDDSSKRQTRVMFCDPISGENVELKRKSKIIKSSLKGSNKTFVYGDNNVTRRESRKRSFTQNDVEEVERKKKRLTIEQLTDSANRLSRPKKLGLSAKKLSPRSRNGEAVTPSTSTRKPIRSKLPDFASLHKKQFENMESLGECQERKAKRALQLLGSAHPERRRDAQAHAASSIPKLQKEKANKTLPVPNKAIVKRGSDPIALNFKEKTVQMKPKSTQNKHLNNPNKRSKVEEKSFQATVKVTKEKNIPLKKQISQSQETVSLVKAQVENVTAPKATAKLPKEKNTLLNKQQSQSKETLSLVKEKAKNVVASKSTAKLPKEKNNPLNKQQSQSKETLSLVKDKPASSSYTRFGFKLDLKSNPFSIAKKPAETVPTRQNGKIANEKVKNASEKQQNLNKSGTTNKEKAIESVMRDKSNVAKIKSDSRNVIKGVRMNRRFELQMKMRNLEG